VIGYVVIDCDLFNGVQHFGGVTIEIGCDINAEQGLTKRMLKVGTPNVVELNGEQIGIGPIVALFDL
jgi:hypothetical protein